jgi:hypothetical protein
MVSSSSRGGAANLLDGDGEKVLELSVATDPRASRGAIRDLGRSEILDLTRAVCETDDLRVSGEKG